MSAPAGTTTSHYATNGHAEQMRQEKARTIATWCWAHGLDSARVAGLDDALRRRVARSAEVNPPSSWNTWAVVVTKLEQAAQRPNMAGQFGVVETPEWVPTTETGPAQKNSSASPKGKDTPGGAADTTDPGSPDTGGLPVLGLVDPATGAVDNPALAASMAAHPSRRRKPSPLDGPVLPRGWAELVASGRTLGHGRSCSISRCSGAAVAATMTVYRCADHPPVRGEWGHGLDYTPRDRTCAPNRCYCGACPSHRLTMTPSPPAPRDEKQGRRR